MKNLQFKHLCSFACSKNISRKILFAILHSFELRLNFLIQFFISCIITFLYAQNIFLFSIFYSFYHSKTYESMMRNIKKYITFLKQVLSFPVVQIFFFCVFIILIYNVLELNIVYSS